MKKKDTNGVKPMARYERGDFVGFRKIRGWLRANLCVPIPAHLEKKYLFTGLKAL
jgi:hypothetical protein